MSRTVQVDQVLTCKSRSSSMHAELMCLLSVQSRLSRGVSVFSSSDEAYSRSRPASVLSATNDFYHSRLEEFQFKRSKCLFDLVRREHYNTVRLIGFSPHRSSLALIIPFERDVLR